MKIINTFLTITALIVGVTMGLYLLGGYEKKSNLKLASLFSEEVLFFKYKTYENEEAMKQDLQSMERYIYMEEEGKPTVYLAITGEKENSQKIKEFFEKKGYSIKEEEMTMEQEDFLNILKQYDAVLKNTDDEAVIDAIIKQVIEKYQEVYEH